MGKKRRSGKKKKPCHGGATSLKDILSLYSEVSDLKNKMGSLSESGEQNEGRLANLEVHLSLLTRLITTLCVERFGIKMGALKRLVKKVESEAIRDSQILELESLYKLSQGTQKKSPQLPAKPKEDPWGRIS